MSFMCFMINFIICVICEISALTGRGYNISPLSGLVEFLLFLRTHKLTLEGATHVKHFHFSSAFSALQRPPVAPVGAGRILLFFD